MIFAIPTSLGNPFYWSLAQILKRDPKKIRSKIEILQIQSCYILLELFFYADLKNIEKLAK